MNANGHVLWPKFETAEITPSITPRARAQQARRELSSPTKSLAWHFCQALVGTCEWDQSAHSPILNGRRHRARPSIAGPWRICEMLRLFKGV
jgi:hypothetical protein